MPRLSKRCKLDKKGEVSVYTLASFIIFMFFGLAFMLTGLGFKAQSTDISQDFQAYLTAGRIAGAVERLNNNCEYECSLSIELPGTIRTALFLTEKYTVSLGPDHVKIETASGETVRYPVVQSGITLEQEDVGRSKRIVVSK